MAAGRRSERRHAVFILYQQDLLGLSTEAALARLDGETVGDYTRWLVCGVGSRREELDRTLGQHVEGWSLGRLGILERAILRLAAYELAEAADVPRAVVIDQAVELAKRFCSEEAGALVNGVLGGVLAAQTDRSEGDGTVVGESG